MREAMAQMVIIFKRLAFGINRGKNPIEDGPWLTKIKNPLG
jgi:hypothetical protein